MANFSKIKEKNNYNITTTTKQSGVYFHYNNKSYFITNIRLVEMARLSDDSETCGVKFKGDEMIFFKGRNEK